MKALISVLLLFASAQGEEAATKAEITGAFGLKLGDKFELTPVMKKKLDNGNDFFIVNPPEKIRNLDLYGVAVTPITHKIYLIGGGQEFKDKSQCLSELNVFKEYLAKRHGKFIKTQSYPDEVYSLANGSRGIEIGCEYNSIGARLMVVYGDLELEKQGKREHTWSEQEKSDMSDL